MQAETGMVTSRKSSTSLNSTTVLVLRGGGGGEGEESGGAADEEDGGKGEDDLSPPMPLSAEGDPWLLLLRKKLEGRFNMETLSFSFPQN